MASEFKGAKVEIGDVFYYKKFPSEFKDLRFQVIAIVSIIVIKDGKYTEIEFESPYGLDLSDVVAVDLTRLGNEQFNYIGNSNTDEFIEVDENGEIFGKITLGNPFSKNNHIEAANVNNVVVHDDVEPVAYKRIYDGGVVGYGNNKSNLSIKNIPLYTSDQLQNKIELTKDEFELLAKVCRGIQPFQKIEKHIKIVPNMKWFVRSNKQYQPDMDQGISESGYLYLTQGDIYSVEYHEMTTFKDEATQFETEDEAKLWTTPDTEAVYLPVEEK